MTYQTVERIDSIFGWATVALASLALGIPFVAYLAALAK
jgi:hypothetical protein